MKYLNPKNQSNTTANVVQAFFKINIQQIIYYKHNISKTFAK